MGGVAEGGRCWDQPFRRQEGSAAVLVFVVVSALAVLAVALSWTARQLTIRATNFVSRQRNESETREELEWVLARLRDDRTPEDNSRFDPSWRAISARFGDGAIEDAASGININWVRVGFLETIGLADVLFADGRGAAAFEEYRRENRPSVDLDAEYAEFFSPEVISEYLTGYGYLNTNAADLDQLRTIYALRTGSEPSARIFAEQVDNARRLGQIWDPRELRQRAGIDHRQTYPVLNTYPAINVNFAHPEILRAIVTAPWGDEPLEQASAKAELLIQERERGEISSERLASIVAPSTEAQHRVTAYLGTRTWFWRVRINADTEAIIAQVPDMESVGVEWRVVELNHQGSVSRDQ